MRDTCSPEAVESLQRRQSMTTWGMLALAVFIAVGMGEWSKRMAASEVIVDEKVLQQAMEIAAERKMEDRAGVNVKVNVNESGKRISKFGIRNSKSENNLSDLSVSAVNPVALAKNHPTAERETRMGGGRFEGANHSATAEAQRRGGVLGSIGNEAATIQTSAGE